MKTWVERLPEILKDIKSAVERDCYNLLIANNKLDEQDIEKLLDSAKSIVRMAALADAAALLYDIPKWLETHSVDGMLVSREAMSIKIQAVLATIPREKTQ
jgi:hypothetical protein